MTFFAESTAVRDVVALGRAGLDLYATQHNTDFSAVRSFEKFVGGSPANTVAALAKRGARTGMLSKVSDDVVGRYVCSYLAETGVDISQICFTDGEARTSLAITEMKPDNCEVVIYRNQAADLLLSPEEIDEQYIADSRVLLISGAALSESPSREAAFYAAAAARQHGTSLVLDIDYRPYSWRSLEEAALYYSLLAEQCKIIIGNRGEFDVIEHLWCKGNTDDTRSAERWFQHNADLVIVKHGQEGSRAFMRDGSSLTEPPFPAPKIQKPFGAGDAFAGNLIYELLQNQDLEYALRRASAAASYVICRNSCSAASPTGEELDIFMQKGEHHAGTYH